MGVTAGPGSTLSTVVATHRAPYELVRITRNCLRYAHPAEANLRLEAERLRDRDARRLRGIYGRAQLGEVAPWSDDCIALKNNSSSMGRSTVHLEYRISLESKPGRQKSPIFPW